MQFHSAPPPPHLKWNCIIRCHCSLKFGDRGISRIQNIRGGGVSECCPAPFLNNKISHFYCFLLWKKMHLNSVFHVLGVVCVWTMFVVGGLNHLLIFIEVVCQGSVGSHLGETFVEKVFACEDKVDHVSHDWFLKWNIVCNAGGLLIQVPLAAEPLLKTPCIIKWPL